MECHNSNTGSEGSVCTTTHFEAIRKDKASTEQLLRLLVYRHSSGQAPILSGWLLAPFLRGGVKVAMELQQTDQLLAKKLAFAEKVKVLSTGLAFPHRKTEAKVVENRLARIRVHLLQQSSEVNQTGQPVREPFNLFDDW